MTSCCFLIDPLATLKPYKDSSIALMFEAQRRGHTVFVAEFSDVSVALGQVRISCRRLTLADDATTRKTVEPDAFGLSERLDTPLDAFGQVFIRKDPPFDPDYFSLTLLLSVNGDQTVFVNDPRGLREISEKIVAARFSQFTPKTLLTYSVETARDFAGAFAAVVLKPAYFGAGDGVAKSAADDADFAQKFDAVAKTEPLGPVIVQEFLPIVAQGDTRVMMIDGEAVGAVGRMPAEGEFRANIAAGGHEFAVELSARQAEICQALRPLLVESGVRFAGVDFIGEHLIEVNVTSPTLIQELKRVSGLDMAALIWDRLEQR